MMLGRFSSKIPEPVHHDETKIIFRFEPLVRFANELRYINTPRSLWFQWSMKKWKVKKIPHCRNSSKIKYRNRRKRQNRYLKRTNTWCSLSWCGTGTSIKFDLFTGKTNNLPISDKFSYNVLSSIPSPWNVNVYFLVQIKFLNLFLYSSK
jgi:hypothetical protein